MTVENTAAFAQSLIEGMLQIPLTMQAACLGKEVRPFLAEVTGLSQSRISQGNLDRLRGSTQKRMQAAAAEWVSERCRRSGYSLELAARHLEGIPKLFNGERSNFGAWVYSYQDDVVRLPRTVAAALELDELLISLLACAIEDDAVGFTRRFQAFESSSAFHVPGAQRVEWDAVSEWSTSIALVSRQLLEVLWRLYALWDAEWGSQYLRDLAPEPIFLFVAPTANEALLAGEASSTNRNQFYRPVRRLLEFSHALAHRGYRKSWPDKPVSRRELGIAMSEDSAHVGNYFDGTRKLTSSAFARLWEVLCDDFIRRGHGGQQQGVPFVVAAVAIGWQEHLLRTTTEKKIQSVVLPDVKSYRASWKYFYDQLNPHPAPYIAEWPTWLLRGSY